MNINDFTTILAILFGILIFTVFIIIWLNQKDPHFNIENGLGTLFIGGDEKNEI